MGRKRIQDKKTNQIKEVKLELKDTCIEKPQLEYLFDNTRTIIAKFTSCASNNFGSIPNFSIRYFPFLR